MPTILIVDDEPKIVQLARDYLERAGFGVTSASDGNAAMAVYHAQPPDLHRLELHPTRRRSARNVRLLGGAVGAGRRLRKAVTLPLAIAAEDSEHE
jgi:ActR/RegA family two-component response regulator